MRILHGPVNVGNQAFELSRAERRHGHQSELVINYDTWLGYGADRVLSANGERDLSSLIRRTWFGLAAPFRYDVLHYYFGRSFVFRDRRDDVISRVFGQIAADMRIARLLGRKVFMTLQGCDARIARHSERRNETTMCREGHCSEFSHCIAHTDDRRREMIDGLLPMCDAIFYLNPELGHDLPPGAMFMPYCSTPIDNVAVVPPILSARPRIVHAPTNGGIKGTPLILTALEQLKARFDFELILVENMRHADAMRAYRDADFAIDQVLAGWYGGFAVEIMAMGKPVACAIRESDLRFVPEAMQVELPILRLRPTHLVEDLACILERRAEWHELGQRSRRFVERWHDPLSIAAKVLAVYRDPDSKLTFDQPAMPDAAS